MKLLATLALGASVAMAARHQKPLHESRPQQPSTAQLNPLEKLKQVAGGISAQAEAAWREVEALVPGAIDAMHMLSSGKAHTRKPDSHWDHIVRGDRIQSEWEMNAQGYSERRIEGKLANYNMRIKAVDPSELGIDEGVTQYSGYLDDEEEDKHLFYWFFESRNDPKNDPVVLWLNGGPGCSSMMGLLMELGPASVDKHLKTHNNPFSWNSNASVIFIDQPVNTGFSYSGGSVSNTIAASKDIYAMLTLFFEQFPQYAKQDFHIAGESYAGHYIPVFASEILSHKKRNINLKSIAIGNGLTDGFTQYAEYEPFACGKGVWPAVLSESQCQGMEDSLPRCQSLIQGCYDSDSVWSCVPAAIYCNNAMMGPYQRTGLNVYDVREPCEDSANLCYPQTAWIADYLNQPKVMRALGAEVDNYASCNFDINRNFLFAGDWMKPFHRLVPGLLEQLPVLIYAGEADYICNYMGNEAWVEALEWPGQKDFNKAQLYPLKHLETKNQTGLVKSSGNFTFMRIHQAGHMVPYDQPEGSLDFFNRWLSGEWYE